ncbi:MAG: hypothetical protein MUF72_11100 [Elainella sp. Prado103]|nr:hypothetical protein [Elainella sp. Prado103]
MRVWAVCVLVIFIIIELYQWFQHFTVPLPIYAVAGLLLSILSNADQLSGGESKQRLNAGSPPTSIGAQIGAQINAQINTQIGADPSHDPALFGTSAPSHQTTAPSLAQSQPALCSIAEREPTAIDASASSASAGVQLPEFATAKSAPISFVIDRSAHSHPSSS